jgi:hypothetical protein
MGIIRVLLTFTNTSEELTKRKLDIADRNGLIGGKRWLL